MKKDCGVWNLDCGLKFLAVILVCLLPLSSSAQSGRKTQNPQKPPSDKADLRIETREVRLPIRAYNNVGKPITDLAPKDVVIIEDGAARQTTSVKLEPANILLVLDLSNEIGTFKNGEGQPDRVWGRPSKTVLPRPDQPRS